MEEQMRDPKIASKSFNPYDLGAVARVTKEFRSSGYYRGAHNEPYVPPHLKQSEAPSGDEDTPEATRRSS